MSTQAAAYGRQATAGRHLLWATVTGLSGDQ
jgi:hypothetical protein